MRIIAEAMFSGDSGPPPADRLDWLVADHEDYLWHAGPRTRLVYRFALFVVMWLAPLLVWRKPLSWQSGPARVQTLQRIEGSAAALLWLLVKTGLCIIYFEHPDAERETGYDGACLLPTSGDSP